MPTSLRANASKIKIEFPETKSLGNKLQLSLKISTDDIDPDDLL